MEEIWKDISGYKGLYQVSNFGRVKSFRASTKYGGQPEYILKPQVINSGYHVVTLYNGHDKHKFQVHRLVATEFLENPEHLPCVNHRDENKLNNRVDNLEWCTVAYNNNYGTAKSRMLFNAYEPIVQKTLNGDIIAAYKSPRLAASLLNRSPNILRSWLKIGMGDGYRWEYL